MTSRFSDKWGGIRRSPYAFTEIGVAMLSSVLKSEKPRRPIGFIQPKDEDEDQ